VRMPWMSPTGSFSLGIIIFGFGPKRAGRPTDSLSAMHILDQLSLRQRVVVVVALGAVALVVGVWVTAVDQPGALFGYAPGTFVRVQAPSATNVTELALAWLALVVVWAVASVALLGTSAGAAPGSEAGAS
jgi:hypothetical protein